MRRSTALAALISLPFLWIACSEDSDSSLGETALSTESEDAVEIMIENVALETGGVLETVEYTILEENSSFDAPYDPLDASKGFRTDDAVFDSSTCTWTFTMTRSAERPFAGHEWNGVRTIHLMDEVGGCIEERDGEGSVKGLDATFDFEGNSWNRRGEWEKTGSDNWQLREMNDDVPGVIVNGSHQRSGSGTRQVSEDRERSYEYTLTMTATDLRVLSLRGRRMPVEGTIHIVFDAVRNGREIHREATITFGDEGDGRLSLEERDVHFDLVSGDRL